MQKTIFHGKTLAAAAAFMLLFAAVLISQETSEESMRETAENSILLEDSGETMLPDESEQEAQNSLWVLVRVVLVLVLVCAGIYGVVFLLKKSTGTSAANDPYIRVVAQLPLAPGKTVQVITVGSQAFLIGLSENGIQHLAEITDQELVDAMNLDADRNPREPVPPFSSLLARFMPKSSVKDSDTISSAQIRNHGEPLSAGETADFIRRQRERLGKTGRNESETNQTGRSE